MFSLTNSCIACAPWTCQTHTPQCTLTNEIQKLNGEKPKPKPAAAPEPPKTHNPGGPRYGHTLS